MVSCQGKLQEQTANDSSDSNPDSSSSDSENQQNKKKQQKGDVKNQEVKNKDKSVAEDDMGDDNDDDDDDGVPCDWPIACMDLTKSIFFYVNVYELDLEDEDCNVKCKVQNKTKH